MIRHQARSWADRIAEWESPDSTVALEARLAVARAEGDERAELEALRGLHDRGRSDRELLERLAALELEHGDADQALHLLEGLVADAPDDESLRSQLAAAQLRFRLRLLPENVQKLAATSPSRATSTARRPPTTSSTGCTSTSAAS